jgi:hypothetical protein
MYHDEKTRKTLRVIEDNRPSDPCPTPRDRRAKDGTGRYLVLQLLSAARSPPSHLLPGLRHPGVRDLRLNQQAAGSLVLQLQPPAQQGHPLADA